MVAHQNLGLRVEVRALAGQPILTTILLFCLGGVRNFFHLRGEMRGILERYNLRKNEGP